MKAQGFTGSNVEAKLVAIQKLIKKSLSSVLEAKDDAWKVAKEIQEYTKKYGHLEGLKSMYKSAFRDTTNTMNTNRKIFNEKV